MPSLVRIASRLETILPLVEAQIVLASGLDTTLVFSTFRSDADLVQRGPTASFIALRPDRFPVYEGAVAGGGNDTLWVDGSFSMTYFTRYAVDVGYADDGYLVDAVNGILPLWSNVINKCQLFDVLDSSGNGLLSEPMRLAAPGWEIITKPPIAGWGRLRSWWELKYLHQV
jgi:hypothetical protein